MNRITTHPGEVLQEEFLKPLGMTVNALALALRVPANRIGAIVKGERAVSAETAIRLGRYFGMEPVFWLNLQTLFDLSKANKEIGRDIKRAVQPRAASPRGQTRAHSRGSVPA